MPALTHHAFTVFVAGLEPSDATANALYEQMDDALFGTCEGETYLDFTREAPTFADAVGSAMHDIEKVGGRVLRVERIED